MDQMNKLLLVLLLVLASLAVAEQNTSQSAPTPGSQEEKHLHNIRQLTFGGQNAEAYFSADGKKLIFQSTRDNLKCDQIFTMNLKRLTTTPGYDAEATISNDGKKIVFTSLRNGDLDIYTMDADGSHVKQLTHELGYDGGPFFSPDGKWIVYRAHHPKTEQEIRDYKELLAQNQIRPTYLELWIMKSDGSDKRQITNLGAASFAPSFFPEGKRIIFASNVGSTGGMGNFELYAVTTDG